jgi:Subtilase family/FG-GAP-like repeat
MRRGRLILLVVVLRVLSWDFVQAQWVPSSAAKIPESLTALYERYSQHLAQSSALSFHADDPLVRQVGDHVVIDAVAAGDVDVLRTELVSLGLQDAVAFGRIVSGKLPISAIPAAAALASLRFAQSAVLVTNAGTATTQGDRSVRADVARAKFGVDGSGIKVGVLSDSYNFLGGAAADIASGDLPADGVEVIQDSAGTDEGRAMLQIVHDVAPGSSLAFATAAGGTANFANNIISLKNAGAKVIVDDIIYLAEPMFQDGIIAQAVDSVVAEGAAYFSAAGNAARNAYQAPFVDSGINLGTAGTGQIPSTATFFAHDFDPGSGVDLFQTITIPTGSTLISFQWADRYFSVSGAPGAQTDLEIAVFDMAGNFLFGTFTRNSGNDPVEVVGATNNNGVPIQLQIAIGKFSGPDPALIKYVALRSSFVVNEFATHGGTIYGHANAVGAEAVGAAAYFNTPAFNVAPPVLEAFSSSGTTPILFDLAGNLLASPDQRAEKPAIVAPDGSNTTFFGNDIAQDADTFPNFFGTSAATPHAAAAAALLLQRRSTLTPWKIYRSLENAAIDMGASGFDNDTGHGFIQADAAFTAALRTTSVDFDGDGASDMGIFRGGAWLFYDFETGLESGGIWTGSAPGCIAAPMDYDGAGTADFTQFCNGAWHFYKADGSYHKGVWTGGVPGDLPVPADYNGDGTDDIVVYRGGAWLFFDFTTGAWDVASSRWTGGGVGCIPAPMDYDGDGTADFTQLCNGAWHFYNDDGSYHKGIWTGGVPGDLPAPADYDGDGTEDVVVFRNGAWLFFDFVTGAWEAAKSTWTGAPPHWNGGTPLPAPLDYNGDGKADFTVYSGGPWHFYNQDGSYNRGIWTGGVAEDRALSRRPLP